MHALALAATVVAFSAVGLASPAASTATTAADRALLSSAAAGNASGVRDALRAGASVTATDSAGSSALILAAYGNRLAVARQLIVAGSDVNQQNLRQESAFLIATSEVGDDPRLLDMTLAAGARVQARDSFDGTGLIRAAERGFPVIVARLIAAGVELDHVNNLGWTALHEAIVLGSGGTAHTEVVRRLVDAGADVMLPSQNDGVRPLEHAERLGQDRIARILRRAAIGLTPNDRLLNAASRGSVVAARTALFDGAALEARDDAGRTALLRAALADRVDVARMLVTRGADVNAYDDRLDTPFLVTGVTGSVRMLEALLPGGPDTRLTNRFGGVAVIPASERGHIAYVREVLLRTDIDVNHVNDLGWTALLEAVLLGDGGPRYARVVSVLLENGADPAIADSDGVTALAHAAQRGHERIARLLR